MGVKGLIQLIKDYAPDAIHEYAFHDFEGYVYPIEMSMLIYQSVIAVRNTSRDLLNSKGQIVSHLQSIMYKALLCLENGNVPIFVQDGRPPAAKDAVLAERRENRENAEKQLKEFKEGKEHTDKEFVDNFKKSYRPTKPEFDELKIMLDLMGIPYIVAPGEAEVTCAWMTNKIDENGKRMCKGVCTDDSDVLVFGAKYMFKDMMKFMKGGEHIKVISLSKVLKAFKLNLRQFQELSVLLGGDYVGPEDGKSGGVIPSVGPVTALQLMRQYGSLEAILEFYKKKKPGVISESHAKDILNARETILKEIRKVEESKTFVLTEDNLSCRTFQKNELLDFMCAKHGFNIMKIKTAVNRLEKAYKKMGVTRPNPKKYHTMIKPAGKIEIDFVESDDEKKSSSDSD